MSAFSHLENLDIRKSSYRESFEINYDQQLYPKSLATMKRRQKSREILNRREKNTRRSKDNLSKTGKN